MALPPLLTVPDIHERLQTIFPEGTENRNYVTREMAARTVFVMLYVGAAVADRVPAVPAYRPRRNLPAEVPSLDVVHAPSPRPVHPDISTARTNLSTESAVVPVHGLGHDSLGHEGCGTPRLRVIMRG